MLLEDKFACLSEMRNWAGDVWTWNWRWRRFFAWEEELFDEMKNSVIVVSLCKDR